MREILSTLRTQQLVNPWQIFVGPLFQDLILNCWLVPGLKLSESPKMYSYELSLFKCPSKIFKRTMYCIL